MILINFTVFFNVRQNEDTTSSSLHVVFGYNVSWVMGNEVDFRGENDVCTHHLMFMFDTCSAVLSNLLTQKNMNKSRT